MHDVVFSEIAWLLLGAAALGLVGTMLHQPVIVSFIAVGIAAAAFFQSSPETASQIGFLAELGVALLLFLVGLKLDWRLVRTLGPVALATGLGQVGFTAGFGFLIGLGLGLDALTSLYVSVALTFSSTIIVVKLLSDKRELETLHGKIALGFLIVQDIVVVLAMVVLSTIGIGAAEARGGVAALGIAVASLVGMALLLALFVRFVADPLMGRLARTPELLVIAAIGWAAAAAAIGDAVGLGKELGGLAAGVSLGSTPYRDMISARLAALRDFLLLFFFLSIGASLDLGSLGDDFGRAIVFSLFVLIGNPLIVLLIMAYMGYRARTGFLAGLTVAQISEFSFIFMAMGLSLGHVDAAAVGLVTLVGLVTIALSVYMITYSQPLYLRLKPLLKPFDFGRWREDAAEEAEEPAVDIVIFGLGRFGSQLLRRLDDAGYNVLGVDLDPKEVAQFSRQGYRVRFGDVTEQEFWAELPLANVRWIVLSVPYGTILLTETDPRSGLMTALKSHRYAGRVAITARDEAEGRQLEESGGVDLIFYPFDEAAVSAARQIADLDAERPAGERAGEKEARRA
ncbi:MAG: cation:proton antiporter [Aquamicrobium sp.]|nr:cation:proton antiporter [Aquamicrobium sp.]